MAGSEALSKLFLRASKDSNINHCIIPGRVDAANCDVSVYNIQSLFTNSFESAGGPTPRFGTGDFVISRDDDRLLVFVEFSVPVKIRSIRLTSLGGTLGGSSGGSKPTRLTLYKNHGSLLDFDDVEEFDGPQFSLSEAGWKEAVPTITIHTGRHFVKLQRVANLNILLTGETGFRTRLDKISFLGDA